jgi:hypothetical protein
MKAGIIPEDVCKECLDIWNRAERNDAEAEPNVA